MKLTNRCGIARGIVPLLMLAVSMQPADADLQSGTPEWTAEVNQAQAEFGYSASTAGDVNGDGWADVIVGSPRYDNGQSNEGRVSVYLGSATGPAATAAWVTESDQAGALYGWHVDTAGDVNADGFADVVVGAINYSNGQSGEGRAYLYLGSSGGLATTPIWTAESNDGDAGMGIEIGPAGDVNDDGFDDVIVGALRYNGFGRAYVFLGSASVGLEAAASWVIDGDQPNCLYGRSVSGAGDVNDDGFDDVIVSADWYDNGQGNEGRVYGYLGSASGLSTVASWIVESNQADATFGIKVADAGDVDRDGYADVVVGAHLYSNGEGGEGRTFLYRGSASGLATIPSWTFESDQSGANLGTSLDAADVNGDGASDVLVGASSYDNGEMDEGRAYIFRGSAAGLSSTPDWISEGNQVGARYGAVHCAGNVNGDMYEDVVVTAREYDNGQVDEGRAFLYFGSPLIPVQPGSIITGPGPVDGNTSLIRTFNGAGEMQTQFTAYSGSGYGARVASCDIDNDGADEILTGPGMADANSGELRVFEPDGTFVRGFTAYGNPGYGGGLIVAGGNVDESGADEILTGTGHKNGNAPIVRIWNGSGAFISEFNAYPGANMGVNVAAGDLDGNGTDEIITGPGPNGSFAPQVSIWRASDGAQLGTYNAYGDFGLTYGVNVAAGDLDGDGEDEIITGPGPNGSYGSLVRVWERSSGFSFSLVSAFEAYGDLGLTYGVIVGAGDVDGDGTDEIVTGPGPNGPYGSTVRIWRRQTNGTYSMIQAIDAYPGCGCGGVNVAVADFTVDTTDVTENWSSSPDVPDRVSTVRFESVHPNPARMRAELLLSAPDGSLPLATLHDVGGRRLGQLSLTRLAAGRFAGSWDLRSERGDRVAPGIYFVRIRAGGQEAGRRVVVLGE